jgi:hypothetical protein
MENIIPETSGKIPKTQKGRSSEKIGLKTNCNNMIHQSDDYTCCLWLFLLCYFYYVIYVNSGNNIIHVAYGYLYVL